jgi:tetratricopeptide (TPR) repeat protein
MTQPSPYDLVCLAAGFRQQGRLRDALLHCDAALEQDPRYVFAWLERGFAFATGGSMGSASECYRQVVALDPANIAANAGLASIMARDGDSIEAREHALRALTIEPDNAIAAAALATMDIESGAPERAKALLGPLVPNAPQGLDRALMASLLGDACNKLDEPDRAFECYTLANDDFAAMHTALFRGRPSHREFVEVLTAGVEAMQPDTWERPALGKSGHAFVTGYPRSGNTLVENILASLPGVEALEERPTLAAADLDFLAAAGGLARFDASSEAELARYRQAYWDKAAAAGISQQAQYFIDMDPLKSTRLPLIARLFPQARVVLMRRDPRDVVWSCFHTHFALSNAAMEFTTLERAARHYDATMRLIDVSCNRLPLNVFELDYHRLISDFDATTRELCAFLGIAWGASLRAFDRTAKRRGVATASAGQVRKGLYDGRAQWRRYERHMQPVMPILMPWVEKFGYS